MLLYVFGDFSISSRLNW